jgi:hypothetical protein
MLLKPRKKSSELLTLEYLNTRMTLSAQDKQHYTNLVKGYEGEEKFDVWTEKLKCNCLILNGLLLEVNNTTFQIDSLIITAHKTYYYEVKNFEGDYVYDKHKDEFFKRPHYKIVNPLHQMEGGETLLNQLLFKNGFNIPIEAAVVFIHEAFTLYQAPIDKPIIYPNQMERYIDKLQSISAKLGKQHYSLADRLISLHITHSRFQYTPSFNYEALRKGITCKECKSFSVFIKKDKCICDECAYEESISDAIIRSVREFQLLFPDKKVTTSIIRDWCQIVRSNRTIAKVLAQNLEVVGKNRWVYYK